jgi:hypothetical protein
LYVQRDGAALRLHWNPQAARRSGILYITDGSHQSRLSLNAQDVRSGMATYWPESKEVTFRLELDGAAAGTIRTSAVAEADRRPSPFDAVPARRSRPPAPKSAAVPLTPAPSSADRQAEEDAPEPTKPSRWRRFTRKIPLIRRLHQH